MSMLQIGLIEEDVFLQMRETYVSIHPEILKDHILAEISDLDKMIDNHLEDLDANKALAVCILLQGRNFLALLIDKKQRRAPKGVAKLISQSTGKPMPVAIYCALPLWQESVKVLLGLLNNMVSSKHYVVVETLEELCDYIVHDELRGVISVSPDEKVMIEYFIRHTLQSLPGWDKERAETQELPPCKNLPMILANIIFTIQDMHELSADQMRDPDMTDYAFNLKKAIGDDIRKFRSVAANPTALSVAVCDDQPEEVEGLLLVLRAWPNIKVHFHLIQDFKDAEELYIMASQYDIVLLDERMGQAADREMQDLYSQEGSSSSVFVSITSGEKPTWAKYHFQKKVDVMREKVAALEFMSFMDKCIEERINRRKMLNG